MVFTKVTVYDACMDANNVVYTENGLHRPTPGTVLESGNVLVTVKNVHPRRGEKYSRLLLPMEWNIFDAKQPVFIKIEEDYCEPTALPSVRSGTIYGWVDSIMSSTEKNMASLYEAGGDLNMPSTELKWHPDWWLNTGANAKYKAGRLKRGPSTYARPDPSTPRLWKYVSSTVLCNDDEYDPHKKLWCCVQYVKNVQSADPDHPYTYIQNAYWIPGDTLSSGGNSYYCLSLEQIYAGHIEDKLGLDPDTVLGAYICPARPFSVGTVTTNGNYAWYETAGQQPYVQTMSVTSAKTDDTSKYIITDPMGSPVGTLPWGLAFDRIDVSCDIGSAGANAVFRFYDSTEGYAYGEGRTFTVPLISVPITTNAASSYVLSGQRTYDMETKRIQNEQQLVSGIANAGTSAIGGAIAGGNAGPVGAAGGAAAGLASAVLGSFINYEISKGYDAQNQAAVDRLMANQAGSTVFNAGGLAWNTTAIGGKWHLVKMTRDSVSLAELSAEQSELGYLTDTQVADCTSLISGKGGLRIEGLEVYGVAPEGARYISQMFARGVHLD